MDAENAFFEWRIRPCGLRRAVGRRRLVWAATLVCLLPLTLGTAAAQTVEDLSRLSLEQLGSIQVSSVLKSNEPLSDAPAAIYVITHDEIMRSGATTLPEILRLAPNLEVAQMNPTDYFITARGFNARLNASFSNKLLVLIDGRSVYTPMFSGVYWDMQPVLPEDIDHIEVISGPGATLWGANAVNGVINVITRPSSETQGGVLTMGAGNYQRNVGLQYGGRLSPNLTYRVHGAFSDFSAFPQRDGTSAHDAWSTPSGGFRIDWTPPGDTVSLQGDLFTADEQPSSFIRGHDLVASWKHDFQDGSSLQLLSYYDHAERDVNNSGGDFFVDTLDIELQHNFTVAGWNQIVWGVGERAIHYRVVNTPGLRFVPSDQTLNLANIFAQDTISLAPRLKLTLGLKLEDEPYAHVQPMPSARLAWKASDSVLLWAAVSRAVRSPTPVDDNIQEWAGPIDVLNGSSAFRPEKLTAYELGTRVQATPRISFSLSAFYDVYDDLRSINPTGNPAGPVFVFGNQMSGSDYGLEGWGTYQVTNWWRLSAGFMVQHQDLRFLPGSSTVVGLAFTANDPTHQESLHSAIDFGHGVTWDTYLRNVGMLSHPEVPGYVELNTRVAWNINKWLQVSLSGFNLLHARHLEFVSDVLVTEVPRSFYAQTRIRF